ncbi:MAG: tetratricopeptide repeat protein [Acidobacteriaceae bacterium]
MVCMLLTALPGNLAMAQSRAVSKQNFAALSAEADAARAADHLNQATVLYKKALALRPAWSEGWWSLGTVEYDQGKYAGAARAFEKLIALKPKGGNGTALVMLGLCEFELGHDRNALRHIEQGKNIGIAKDNQLQDVMNYHEGILLQRFGKFEGAREVLDELCANGVHSKELANGLGMVALQMRDKDPPLQEPEAQIVASVGVATCLAAQHKFDQAQQVITAVVQQYPDFPYIHYAYGRLLLDVDHPKAATLQFKQEIKDNPGDAIARLQIAAANYRVDSAAGLPYAEEAVKLDPNYPFGHYLLGLLLLDTGSYRKAIPELEIARRYFPQEAQVYFALGSAYAHVGRKQDAARARATFARLQQQSSEPERAGGEMDTKPQQ